jgi:hypothetical protein
MQNVCLQHYDAFRTVYILEILEKKNKIINHQKHKNDFFFVLEEYKNHIYISNIIIYIIYQNIQSRSMTYIS